jgi:hypothetical protein
MTTGFSKIQFVYPYLLEWVKGAGCHKHSFLRNRFFVDIFNVKSSGVLSIGCPLD